MKEVFPGLVGEHCRFPSQVRASTARPPCDGFEENRSSNHRTDLGNERHHYSASFDAARDILA
jgi:hypothetical protein